MFIDRYEFSDVVEDRNNFLTRMEDVKPYMVELEQKSPKKLISIRLIIQ